jgi:hypothetical protein
LRHLKNQTEVKAVQSAQNIDLSGYWFAALAVVFAGVFYFGAYYFGGDWWRVLTGG